jgi:hypothetical protein
VRYPTFLTGGSELSPGFVSYQRTTRAAPRHPSSPRRPSIVIRPAARVMRIVSPESADCAAAELGSAAAIAAAASGPAIRVRIERFRRTRAGKRSLRGKIVVRLMIAI